jgi:hypothetical protein
MTESIPHFCGPRRVCACAGNSDGGSPNAKRNSGMNLVFVQILD